MSRYEHTDDVHNSGVVWGRVSQVHPALLQHMDVIVSVATEWNNNQLPIPTTRKIVGTQCCVTLGYGVRHLPGWEPIHSCVWTLFFFFSQQNGEESDWRSVPAAGAHAQHMRALRVEAV